MKSAPSPPTPPLPHPRLSGLSGLKATPGLRADGGLSFCSGVIPSQEGCRVGLCPLPTQGFQVAVLLPKFPG